jgi:uncharacterized protein YbjT (DUF2867 family)
MGRRTYLVTGATGRQGGAVARSLLKRGQTVRAFTREPAKAQTLRTLGAEVVAGDLRTGEGLAEALRGVDGFFLVTTPFERGEDAPDFERERHQGRSALHAAKAAGTPHTVLSSARPASGDGTAPMFAPKAANEAVLREFALPATILRPATFMDHFTEDGALALLREGHLRFPAPPETRLELVAVDDIGEAAANIFEGGASAFGAAVDLTGDSHTLLEIARMLGSWIGRTVRFAPEDAPGAEGPFGQFAPVQEAEAEHREIEREIEALERRWGLHMTRFATYLASTPVPRLDSER